MRGMLIALATVLVMAAATSSQAAATSTGAPTLSPSSTVYALQVPSQPPAPDKKIDIDISTNQGHGGRWYANPVWIAIGAVAAVVVLLLIVLAARGGGTTVIKE